MKVHRTQFAPAERADAEDIHRDHDILIHDAVIEHVTRTIPSILLVLNTQRQAVFVNRSLLELLGVTTDEELIGKRPGEIFSCVHAAENRQGCGTTRFCRNCGAVMAILHSQRRHSRVCEECRIVTTTGEALDFRVWATPLDYRKGRYTVFTVLDISHEKRREALERTFFHDVNNILAGLLGHSEILPSIRDREQALSTAGFITDTARQLVSEIDSQRKLLEAEDDRLALRVESGLVSLEVLSELRAKGMRWWPRNPIEIRGDSEEFTFSSDPSLLNRVLFNMLKNAVEDSGEGSPVTLKCFLKGTAGIFQVHNRGFMPQKVQLQVFQRSFSTKGRGRGIGAYSMKLFGEKYLGGRIWFTSAEEEGTSFFFSFPLA